jgi:F-type H+-transporting ATPase subunit b
VSDDLAAAERLKEQSNAAHAAYEKALDDARNRAHTIASSTREQQAREAEALHKRLEAQLNERFAAADQSIAKSRAVAMGSVRTIAGETAAAIVERLIGQRPRQEEIAAALGDPAKS